MTMLNIEVSRPMEARLRRQAAAAGKPLEQYICEVLEADSNVSRLLSDMSGPAGQHFADSGFSDDELAEQLEREDHAARGVPYDT